VPVGATTGFITATSGVGTATSTSVFTVTNLRPNIVSISPTTGAEGTTVTISGFNLGGVTSLTFGTVPATFFPLNGNTLQAFVPAGLTGSNFIFVDGVSGRDTSLQQFTVLAPSFCGAPTVARPRLIPTTTSNSTLVTAGSAYAFKFFGSRDSVYIFSTCNSASGEDSFLRIYDRNGAAIISQSDDGGSYCSGLSASIEFTPTASDTFIVHLSRFQCFALQTDQLLTYFRRAITAAPVILNFEPASGLVGTQVEISGANFTGVSAVRLNGVATVFNTLGLTRIQFTVPAGATSGPITVVTAAGTGTSSSNYTVLTATSPIVTFIAPTSGSEGTVISINGTNLGPNPTVTINGVAVTGLTVDPTFTTITATVAPGTTTGVVRVTTANGTFTTTDPFIITRTAPVITAVTPNSGVVGTTITISGSSLLNPTSVSFNGTPAVVTASTNNSITV
ncbi:MAG: IPT/TIG domain-containing protein, partial [Flexibacteraceae bacterium]